jgi:2-polyprenyl-3-methyl-5-hydroxy-6-metoxy-1,4-benzoquinol methylase
MTNTDQEWEQWGRQDPYFAVITHPKFRSAALDDSARNEFFSSGRSHVDYVLAVAARQVRADFPRRRALDFGCGVGRVTLAMAAHFNEVVGVDVSPSMLEEAARNAYRAGIGNITWVLSDDTLSRVEGQFDLVHTAITLQHIEIPRGRILFKRLVEMVAPGGIGAIQVTYAKASHAATFGQAPSMAVPSQVEPTTHRNPLARALRKALPSADPEMQMNAYSLGELAFILQSCDVASFHGEFTDHGGELGVFLYFQKSA